MASRIRGRRMLGVYREEELMKINKARRAWYDQLGVRFPVSAMRPGDCDERNRMRLAAVAAMTIAMTVPALAAGKVCNVTKFGAKGDGATEDTAAVQKAIDTCAAAKGAARWWSRRARL